MISSNPGITMNKTCRSPLQLLWIRANHALNNLVVSDLLPSHWKVFSVGWAQCPTVIVYSVINQGEIWPRTWVLFSKMLDTGTFILLTGYTWNRAGCVSRDVVPSSSSGWGDCDSDLSGYYLLGRWLYNIDSKPLPSKVATSNSQPVVNLTRASYD